MKATLPYTIALGVGMTIVAGASGQTQNPPGVNPQHYECYNVDKAKPVPPRRVALRDQFGLSQTTTATAMLLCNPVSKNNEETKDALTHLVCYAIRPRRPPGKRVEVVNQFGAETLTVGTPSMLCVPSRKRIAG